MQAQTWEAALAMLRDIPGLQLSEEQAVYFCELYDLLQMHGRLEADVSNLCLDSTLNDISEFLRANVVTAIREYATDAISGAAQDRTDGSSAAR